MESNSIQTYNFKSKKEINFEEMEDLSTDILELIKFLPITNKTKKEIDEENNLKENYENLKKLENLLQNVEDRSITKFIDNKVIDLLILGYNNEE